MSFSAYDRWLDEPLHQRDQEEAESDAQKARAMHQAESLAAWPLLQTEQELMTDHFSALEWNEKQSLQFENLVIKLVLGEPVNAADCSEFLTIESMREIIAEHIVKTGKYFINDNED